MDPINTNKPKVPVVVDESPGGDWQIRVAPVLSDEEKLRLTLIKQAYRRLIAAAFRVPVELLKT
jgi:hypothetical protein